MPENVIKTNPSDQQDYDLSQRVLDSLTSEVAVLDKNGTIIAVNQAWRQFAVDNGGSEETCGLGANYLNVCRNATGENSEGSDLVCHGIQQVIEGSRDIFKFEYPCHSPDEKRWFLLHVSRLHGIEPYVVTTHLPITERILAEKRLVVAQRLAAIGEAMQGLSHEGRNALQRAQAHIALLRLHLEENPEATELLQKIEATQDHLLELYEEVKDYAAPIALKREAYRVDKLVEIVWKKLNAASSKSTSLSLDIQTDDPTCNVDVDATKRVLEEILKNALAAVGESPEIEIQLVSAELNGQPALTVVVSDNGPGIPDKDGEFVFQPFYTTKTQGTGLGLAVCKRIVLAHGGSIHFGTPRLGGASVYITLLR